MQTAITAEQANVQTVQAIFDAFNRGDVPSILESIAEDIVWRCHFDPIVPWGGDRNGEAMIPGFFQAIAESVEVLGFEPEQIIAQDDTVISTGTFTCKPFATGKTAHTRWAFIWKFNGGKVVSYEQFHDPAIADAFRV